MKPACLENHNPLPFFPSPLFFQSSWSYACVQVPRRTMPLKIVGYGGVQFVVSRIFFREKYEKRIIKEKYL